MLLPGRGQRLETASHDGQEVARNSNHRHPSRTHRYAPSPRAELAATLRQGITRPPLATRPAHFAGAAPRGSPSARAVAGAWTDTRPRSLIA